MNFNFVVIHDPNDVTECNDGKHLITFLVEGGDYLTICISTKGRDNLLRQLFVSTCSVELPTIKIETPEDE